MIWCIICEKHVSISPIFAWLDINSYMINGLVWNLRQIWGIYFDGYCCFLSITYANSVIMGIHNCSSNCTLYFMSKQNFPIFTHPGSAVCGDWENAAVLWGYTEIEDGSSMTFQNACGPPIIGRALNIDMATLFRTEKDQTYCCHTWEQGGHVNTFKIKDIFKKPSCTLGC